MQVFLHMTDFINQRINILPRDMKIVNNLILSGPSIGKSYVEQARYKLRSIVQNEAYKETVVCESETEPAPPPSIVGNVAVAVQAKRDGTDYGSTVYHMTTYYSDDHKPRNTSVLEAGYVNSYVKAATDSSVAPEQISECCDKRKAANADAISPRIQLLCESFEQNKSIDILEEKYHSQSNQIPTRNVQKLRQDDYCDVNERKKPPSITSKVICFLVLNI